MTQSLPGLSILIVSYNTRDLTLACLRSIDQFPPAGPFEVIVVDNDSADDSVEAIRTQHPEVQLLESGGNVGFAKANNIAMQAAQHEVLVLLNSDTEVHEHALTRLQEALAEHPDWAGGAGRLLNSDGTQQFNLRYFPRLSSLLSETFFLHHLQDGPHWSELEHRQSEYEYVHPVEVFSGAYLALRRKWYDRIGGLDAGFFMYSEDTDWCQRISKAGGKLVYLPDSVVTHHGGGSSQGSPRLYIVLNQARDRYFRLHFSKAVAFFARAILAFNLVLRAIGLLPLAVIRSGLRPSILWRLQGATRLYTQPLDLKTDYE